MGGLIIVGDEAWTPEEWEAEERRRAKDRDRYRLDPDRRQKVKAAVARFRERNPDRYRAYRREWIRKQRGGVVVGSLHDLACIGPTRRTGCVCRKIKCYDRPRSAAQ